MHMFNKSKSALKDITQNLFRLLGLSWKTDKSLTFCYLGTAGLSAIFPIIASYIYKLFIDNLIHDLGIKTSIPFVLIAILGSRYISSWIWDFVSWVLKETYYDYLLRYKLQNIFNKMFCRKLSALDIQHLEDSKTQDLINKARDTLTWRPPDFLRAFSYLFTNIIAYLSSFILLAGYGWYL